MKILPVRAELFHADRHDVTNLTVELRNFANAPENVGTWIFDSRQRLCPRHVSVEG
jgi:hypothetical protein